MARYLHERRGQSQKQRKPDNAYVMGIVSLTLYRYSTSVIN